MSDLEFQRELSPDQLREALSLLDRAATNADYTYRIDARDLVRAEEHHERAIVRVERDTVRQRARRRPR